MICVVYQARANVGFNWCFFKIDIQVFGENDISNTVGWHNDVPLTVLNLSHFYFSQKIHLKRVCALLILIHKKKVFFHEKVQ